MRLPPLLLGLGGLAGGAVLFWAGRLQNLSAPAAALAAAHLLTSLATAAVWTAASSGERRRLLRLEPWLGPGFLLLASFLLLTVRLWKSGPAVALLLAAGLIARGIVLLGTLTTISHRRLPVLMGVVLVALLLPCSLHLGLTTEMSGDEPYFLLVAHSLWADGDLDLTNQYELDHSVALVGRPLVPQIFDPLVEGRFRSRHSPAMALLVLPALLAGPRVGAALTMAILGGLLGALLCWAIRRAGFGPRGSVLAAAIGCLSPPVFAYTGVVFTELPAAVLTALCLTMVVGSPRSRKMMVLILAAGTLIWLKPRFGFLAAPALMSGLLRFRRSRRLLLLTAGSAALGVGGLAVVNRLLYGHPLIGHRFTELIQITPGQLLHGGAAMLAHQDFGLLLYAPLLLALPSSLAGPGARRLRWLVPLLTLPYLMVVAALAEQTGGHCPPARFVVAAFPLLAVGLAPLLDRPSAPPTRVLLTIAAGVGLAWNVAYLVAPELRWTPPGSTNLALGRLAEVSGLDLLPILPGGGAAWIWLLPLLALAVVPAFPSRTRQQPARIPVLAVVLLAAALPWTAGRVVLAIPTGALQAEGPLVHPSRAPLYWEETGSLIQPYEVGRTIAPGGCLRRSIHGRDGPTRLVVRAAVEEQPPGESRLELLLDGRSLGTRPVRTDRFATIPFSIPGGGGEHRLELRVPAEPGAPGIRVDRFRLEPALAGGPAHSGSVETRTGITLGPDRLSRWAVAPPEGRVPQGDIFQLRMSGEGAPPDPASWDGRLALFWHADEIRLPLPPPVEDPAGGWRLDCPLRLDPREGSGRFIATLRTAWPSDPSAVTRRGAPVLGELLVEPRPIPVDSRRIRAILGGQEQPDLHLLGHAAYLGQGDRVELPLPEPIQTQAVILISQINHVLSVIPYDAEVGRLTLQGPDGALSLPLVIGRHTAEDRYAFPGVQNILAHQEPPVADQTTGTAYGRTYESRCYIVRLPLAEPWRVSSVLAESRTDAGVLALLGIALEPAS